MEQETNTMIETINDAMTAGGIIAACRSITSAAEAGSKASIVVSSNAYSSGDAVSLIISDSNYKQLAHFQSGSFQEVLTAGREWAATHQTVRRNGVVRRMALAVIELTDEHGACTETLLRGKGFVAAEIVEFHEAACVRAGEMAGNAPFQVVF